jgi:hypothetical protein
MGRASIAAATAWRVNDDEGALMIDPITGATAVANIVSLLADFVASRRLGQAPSTEDFMQWLRDTGRTDVVDAISRSHQSTISLKAIFNEKSDEILRRLQDLDSQLARVAAAFGPIGELALAMRPEARLSDGAVEVLVAMERAGAGMAIEAKDLGGPTLVFDANSINFAPRDSRFYEDDIAMLVESGMLRQSWNRSGGRVFHITRQGAQFARSVLHAADDIAAEE